MLLFILALVSFSALNVLANPIRPSKHKWYSPNPPHIGMPQVNPRDIDVQEVSHLATVRPIFRVLSFLLIVIVSTG